MEIIKALAYRPHFCNGGGILYRQGIESERGDSFHDVSYLIRLWHVFVNSTTQSDDVFYVRSVGFLRVLYAGVQFLFGSSRASRGRAEKLTQLLSKATPIRESSRIIVLPGLGHLLQGETNVL